jgi:hypothetical protein
MSDTENNLLSLSQDVLNALMKMLVYMASGDVHNHMKSISSYQSQQHAIQDLIWFSRKSMDYAHILKEVIPDIGYITGKPISAAEANKPLPVKGVEVVQALRN